MTTSHDSQQEKPWNTPTSVSSRSYSRLLFTLTPLHSFLWEISIRVVVQTQLRTATAEAAALQVAVLELRLLI